MQLNKSIKNYHYNNNINVLVLLLLLLLLLPQQYITILIYV